MKTKEPKGKLYITFSPTISDKTKFCNRHTDVYHGVKKSNVDKLVNKKSGREIEEFHFVENKTNRQTRKRGNYTFPKN